MARDYLYPDEERDYFQKRKEIEHQRRMARAGELGAKWGRRTGIAINWASYAFLAYVAAHFIWKYW